MLCVVIGKVRVSTFTLGPEVCAYVSTHIVTKTQSFCVGAFSNRVTGCMSIKRNFFRENIFRTGTMAGLRSGHWLASWTPNIMKLKPTFSVYYIASFFRRQTAVGWTVSAQCHIATNADLIVISCAVITALKGVYSTFSGFGLTEDICQDKQEI